MYEVEIKVEISAEKSLKLFDYFRKEGFSPAPAVMQNDYYIAAAKSPFGGWDVKRYREEGATAFYTEKVWETLESGRARREIEKEVSIEELRLRVAAHPDALKIQKLRRPFVDHRGIDRKIHIDMNRVKFDHSPEMRYFIEAEIIAGSAEEVGPCKELVIAFLKEALRVSDLQESPGMFTMAFEKL